MSDDTSPFVCTVRKGNFLTSEAHRLHFLGASRTLYLLRSLKRNGTKFSKKRKDACAFAFSQYFLFPKEMAIFYRQEKLFLASGCARVAEGDKCAL